MFDLSRFSGKFVWIQQGYWSVQKNAHVPYPNEGYDVHFALEDSSFWFAHRSQCIVQLIHSFPPQGLMFDIGGGNGIVTAAILRAGFEPVLIEPGLQGILNAVQRGLPIVLHASLEDAEFHPNCIPAIGLFDVIEHVENDRIFLETVKKLLICGGRLYLTVPAYQRLWSPEDEYLQHYRRYNLTSLKKLLRSAGFEIEFSSYLFWFLPIPIFLFRSIPGILRRRRSIDKILTKDHKPPHFPARWLLRQLLRFELQYLRHRSIPFGSSCVVVAKRID